MHRSGTYSHDIVLRFVFTGIMFHFSFIDAIVCDFSIYRHGMLSALSTLLLFLQKPVAFRQWISEMDIWRVVQYVTDLVLLPHPDELLLVTSGVSHRE